MISSNFLNYVESLVQGAMYPAISDTDVKRFKIKYPKSKSDQQRIASEIKLKLEKVEQMRQAALQQKEAVEAMQGALLREVFPYKEGDELPKGWKWEKIGDILQNVQYGISEELNTTGEGFKIFRMNEIENFRMKDGGNMKCANVSKKVFNQYKLQIGDVLFNRTNSFELVGKSGLFELEGDYCFASHLIRLKPNLEKIIPLFLSLTINSPFVQERLKEIATRAVSQANINSVNLKKIEIAIPQSLSVQNEIANKVNSAIRKLISLKQQSTTQLEAIEAMPAAILREVFDFNTKKTNG